MTAILALILKFVGVGFLIVAAVGVMRFADPFQRMHAATKAGTLGAGLVVLGTLVGQGSSDVALMGSLTILFLLLTVPVAGHLLGRAAYISGTPLVGLTSGDALDGILTREALPPRARLADGDAVPMPALAPTAEDVASPEEQTAEPRPLERLADVRLALILSQEERAFARAHAIACRNEVPLTAHAIVDSRTIELAEDKPDARARIRKACAASMAALQEHMEKCGAGLTVRYDEGVPEAVLRHGAPGRTLLVVPQDGWFHHGVEPFHSDLSWAPDGLLRLPAVHEGPILYAGHPVEEDAARVVLQDGGEEHLPELVDWALQSRLWPTEEIWHVGSPDPARAEIFEQIANRHGARYTKAPSDPKNANTRAAMVRVADAAIIGTMPRPLRARWYGMPWTERIAPGFRGDVLAMETAG
ncbi:monovalent cation/H(+) antiporter subunit G [Acuticoccus sp. M5D2P5]|uniref:monovalent cation/H(+) antiporter subunit G n=1 Tax=Acuticoccus kalidii TaxID=2910977 RepID=UPI001F3CAEF4|nr:monovalent cation/H(+) antiporter subunit G [Acuticoccus kalidii]MCF3932805.1 monovalent cation/H(+) antiporter subunit G [Acuticoccus kalidii]